MKDDYKKIDRSHRLSSYQVKLPFWHGEQNIRTPFKVWAAGEPLDWYRAYNVTKHNRSEGFKEATLKHAVDAVCAVLVLLAAQFGIEDFTDTLFVDRPQDGFKHAIGGYFLVRYPDNWPLEERYDFMTEWYTSLTMETDPFQNFPYPL
jgi:hypothetical protein